MTDGFRALIDPQASGGTTLRIEAYATTPLVDVVMRLQECFDAEPETSQIELVIDDELLGLVTRTWFDRLFLPVRVDLGSADGATLAGVSRQYKPLTYMCRSCDAKKKVMFADEAPQCPEHGPMDRVS